MDWSRGFRAGVALCAPIILGDLVGIPNLAWASVGGFTAIVADSGGPYRTRLSSIVTLLLGGSTGFFLSSLCGDKLYWALPVTALFCFIWNYLPVLGQPFSSASISVQVIFFCGIGSPSSSLHEVLGRCLLLLAGGVWAIFLALLLWPLDAYRPARSALSACYTELASFLEVVADLFGSDQQGASRWHHLAQYHQPRVRRAIEEGWQAVAAIRVRRSAETDQGRQLVVLLELADLLLARTVALTEHLETAAGGGDAACKTRGLTGLDELRSAELWIADLLLRRRSENPATAEAKRQQMERLPDSLGACLGQGNATSRFLLIQFTKFAALLETAIESATMLRMGKSPRRSPAPPFAASVGHFGYVYERLGLLRQDLDPQRMIDELVANFTPKSLIFRHAARISLVCGLDIILSIILHIDHGYWLLLTSLIVLQPHISGTMRRGVERIGGTVAGGIFAALLAVALHSPLMTAAVIFPLALLSLAMRPISYTAFAFFLTPAFILVWLPYSGDWQLALVRVADTIAGSLIAVAAMLVLFPVYERERAPEFLRASVEANRRYLALLAEAWRTTTPTRSRSTRPLADARRASGLAHSDTEESLERLLAESWPGRLPFAQFVTAFVAYLRRFGQSVTALATLDGEWAWKQSVSVQGRLDLLNRRLEWLKEQIGNSQQTQTNATSSFASWPEPGMIELRSAIPALHPAEDHPGERQIERLERQTEVLHRELQALHDHGLLPGVPPV
jgi:uncharacterized membrane protein YccC